MDGKTPVSYRNWNDGWGNVFEFNPGYTSTNAAYHILPLTGTTASTIPGVLTNYITSPTAPLAGTNYYSTTIFETPVSVAFLPTPQGHPIKRITVITITRILQDNQTFCSRAVIGVMRGCGCRLSASSCDASLSLALWGSS